MMGMQLFMNDPYESDGSINSDFVFDVLDDLDFLLDGVVLGSDEKVKDRGLLLAQGLIAEAKKRLGFIAEAEDAEEVQQ